MLLSFHKFPSSWSRTPAVSPAFPWLLPKFANPQIVAKQLKIRKIQQNQRKIVQFGGYCIPLKMVRLSERSKFRRFSAYLPWHADPVTKSGTHRSPPFLHCHLTTPKISSQRFRPICNTLVTNRRFCYSLT